MVLYSFPVDFNCNFNETLTNQKTFLRSSNLPFLWRVQTEWHTFAVSLYYSDHAGLSAKGLVSEGVMATNYGWDEMTWGHWAEIISVAMNVSVTGIFCTTKEPWNKLGVNCISSWSSCAKLCGNPKSRLPNWTATSRNGIGEEAPCWVPKSAGKYFFFKQPTLRAFWGNSLWQWSYIYRFRVHSIASLCSYVDYSE